MQAVGINSKKKYANIYDKYLIWLQAVLNEDWPNAKGIQIFVISQHSILWNGLLSVGNCSFNDCPLDTGHSKLEAKIKLGEQIV